MTENAHNKSGKTPIASQDWQLIIDCCQRMERADTSVPLQTLAEQAGVSQWQLQRLFKRRLGCSPKQYSLAIQRSRLQQELQSQPRVIDAAYAAGFESISRFYAHAQTMLGMSPSQYREGGDGEYIHYAVATTSLGEILVAATEAGVCSVEFGASETSLVQQLQERFPSATIDVGGGAFSDTVSSVVELVETPGASSPGKHTADGKRDSGFTTLLPVDISGTVFQEQVWRVLCGIPTGATMSYSQVATALGKPKAHRAVANACAANPVALLIPCHRVVRSDGKAGGYRWGLARKRQLLDAERQSQG